MIKDTLISKRQATIWRKKVDRLTNDQRGKLEQYDIHTTLPDVLFAYVRQTPEISHMSCCVTVWTGLPLGYGTLGKISRYNFGDKRQSMRVTINGQAYVGTYYTSAGDYCRLRKAKR